jgi:hypothetical protein
MEFDQFYNFFLKEAGVAVLVFAALFTAEYYKKITMTKCIIYCIFVVSIVRINGGLFLMGQTQRDIQASLKVIEKNYSVSNAGIKSKAKAKTQPKQTLPELLNTSN